MTEENCLSFNAIESYSAPMSSTCWSMILLTLDCEVPALSEKILEVALKNAWYSECCVLEQLKNIGRYALCCSDDNLLLAMSPIMVEYAGSSTDSQRGTSSISCEA